MKNANNAPFYCAGLYIGLTDIARKHGYALAVHGSMARDFDLVCVPWTEEPSQPSDVIKEITSTYAFKEVGEPGIMNHGRLCYTLVISFNEVFLDISFMPIKVKEQS